MSFNGSGTFVINSSGQPVVANTVISTTVFNALTADLATGLSTCVTKDGQTIPTANLPMGTFKLTNLGVGSAATDSATLGQVQASTTKLVTVTGTDTITGTLSPALAAYTTGQMFYFVAGATNTSAVTLNIDGLGARNVTRHGSTALVAGDILSGEVCVVVYDGTRFQLLNPASYTNLGVTGNLTLSGGTANGVLYLNGSKVATSGAALVFDGANLGIGTASPASRLHVQENGVGAYAFTRVTNTSSTATLIVGVGGSAVANSALQNNAIIYNSGNSALVFGTNDTERMRLDSAGNLGIGTASPAAKLDVNGGGLFTGLNVSSGGAFNSANTATFDTDNAGAARFYSRGANASTVGSFQWRLQSSNGTIDTQAMTLDASGNFDLGTTGGSDRYQNIIATSAKLTFNAGTGFTGSAATSIYNQSAIAMVFGTNSTERARITGAGSVVAGGSVALTTTATDGFLYVPTCAGTPTGTPTAITGMAPIVVNTTNNKLYFYSGGSWRDAGP